MGRRVLLLPVDAGNSFFELLRGRVRLVTPLPADVMCVRFGFDMMTDRVGFVLESAEWPEQGDGIALEQLELLVEHIEGSC